MYPLLLNNIKRFQLLIVLIIGLGNLFSQTYNITGTVLEDGLKTPLSNVNVYIKNSDLGTITNQDGSFHLIIKYPFSQHVYLHFKMIGFSEKVIPLKLTKSIVELGEIHLIAESLELESIHVHSHQHKQHHVSDITLSGQELNDNLSGTLATTLTHQTNIGISSFGVVTSKPVLRGFSGDRFLLTKDGNVMGDLSQTSIDHAITLEMTEVNEIEIVRGPKALTFGSNAIGGVINTNVSGDPKVRFESFHTKINVGGESFNNGMFGNIFFYIPIKNNQINVSMNKRSTQNQTSPMGELENTQSHSSNFKLGFTNYYSHSYLNVLIENYNMQYGIPPSEEGHISGVDLELVKNTLQLNYHRDISWFNLNQLDVKYSFIDYEHGEFESNSDYRAVGLLKNTHFTKIEFKSNQSIIGSDIQYKQFSSEGFYWTPATNELDFSIYGFFEDEFKYLDVLGSFRVGFLAIQPQKPFGSFSNLEIGEVKNRNFNYFSSSIGVKRKIELIELDGWFMSTMRAPSLEELYSDGPHLGTYSYEIGTPNLDLEKIFGIESSIKYKTLPITMSLTSFYNYSPYYYQMSKMGECEEEFVEGEDHPCAGADFIEWGSGPGWLYKYQTKGVEATIKGLEFNFSYEQNEFNIEYDFSLVRGYDVTNQMPLSYINPDKQMLILGYQKNYLNFKFRISNIHTQTRLGEFETNTPSSILADFILGYHKNNKNITLQLNNLFNTEYYNHLSKIKNIMPEAGRNIIVNYQVFL